MTWRADSVRLQRLRAAWDALILCERVPCGASVDADDVHGMRRAAAHAMNVVGETPVRIAVAPRGSAITRAVGSMLRTSDDRRGWMVALAPTNADSPEAWEAGAARRESRKRLRAPRGARDTASSSGEV